jgi:hypothetical protein
VIQWLTGFDRDHLDEFISNKATFLSFFQQANLNPNAHLIKGVICGYRIEEIDNPLTRQVRYLDKLVDELSKGKKMEKILRTEKYFFVLDRLSVFPVLLPNSCKTVAIKSPAKLTLTHPVKNAGCPCGFPAG